MRPPSRRSTSSPSCSSRATRSSTAATPAGPTTRRAPRPQAKQDIDYVDVGISGGVWGLEVGYCMMVGGPRRRRRSASRRSSTCSRRRPPRSTARAGGTSGPSAPGHYVKMVHNGIEYGLMQAYAEGFSLFDARVRARQREDRPPLDAGLGRPLVAVRARRAWPSSRRATTSRELAPFVEDSGEGRWTVEDAIDKRRPDAGASRPRSTSASARAGRTRFPAKVNAALRNQFGGHAIQKPADG